MPCEVCERPATHTCGGLNVPTLHFCGPCAEAHARECPHIRKGEARMRAHHEEPEASGSKEIARCGRETGHAQAPGTLFRRRARAMHDEMCDAPQKAGQPLPELLPPTQEQTAYLESEVLRLIEECRSLRRELWSARDSLHALREVAGIAANRIGAMFGADHEDSRTSPSTTSSTDAGT